MRKALQRLRSRKPLWFLVRRFRRLWQSRLLPCWCCRWKPMCSRFNRSRTCCGRIRRFFSSSAERAAGRRTLFCAGEHFEQTLVLLNGFRIDDSQTAHHNLDLPVPLDAMDSIEVLHGAGSTLHGVDALSGVVDFLTAAPTATTLRLRAGGGSFGSEEESLLGTLVHKRWSGRLTADRDFSTGFMTDRDYRNEDSSLESWASSRLGVTDLLVAVSDRSFGANQFYGPYNSWERTKGWFASARQELGSRTEAAFGYRRHTDEFVLCCATIRRSYENNHIDGSWQASLRQRAGRNTSVLLLGLEEDGDSIHSNQSWASCAQSRRGLRGSGFAPRKEALEFVGRSAGGDFFRRGAVGALAASGGEFAADGQAEAAVERRVWIQDSDLYRPLLLRSGDHRQSESQAGVGMVGRWRSGLDAVEPIFAFGYWVLFPRARHNRLCALRRPRLNGRRQSSGLHLREWRPSLTWMPAKSQRIQVAWTGLAGAQALLNGLQSEYALNYPVENIHATWTASLGHALLP